MRRKQRQGFLSVLLSLVAAALVIAGTSDTSIQTTGQFAQRNVRRESKDRGRRGKRRSCDVEGKRRERKERGWRDGSKDTVS
jgi:hypothetical protein